jgi:hypothetical protein
MTPITPLPPEPTYSPPELSANYVVSSAGRQGTYEKVMVRVAIRGQDKIIHTTTAMIDCGATENFIDREYARQNWIPLSQKAVPRQCLAVDGTEVLGGPITHEALLDVTINNHEETVRLQCITIGNSSIILGLPWLRKHNPTIDWKENRVSFSSEYCAKKCLDTSPHAVTVPENKATQEYFKKVPEEADDTLTMETSSLDDEYPEEVVSISIVDTETFDIECGDGSRSSSPLCMNLLRRRYRKVKLTGCRG